MLRKKILCSLLCLTMFTGMLTGCGGQTPSPSAGRTPAPQQTTKSEPAAENSPTDQTAPVQEADPEPQVVSLSDPIDIALWQEENTSDLMDLAYYVSGTLDVGDLGDSSGTMVRSFTWDEEHYSVLKDYVALLCAEYDYEQAGETYYMDYGSVKFFAFSLYYTGDKFTLPKSIEAPFSKTLCDVTIEGKIEYGKVSGRIWYDKTITADDDGYRHGQVQRLNTQPGPSVGAGLEYYDGTYRTTDGRLSTTLNHASILTDGEVITYDARYEINQSKKHLAVYAENDYGDAIQNFYVPTLSDWHDGFYPASYFVKESSFAVKDRGIEDSLPTHTWSTQFTTVHNGSYVYPVLGLAGEMTGLSFRVMYRDEETIVFYTCATFRSEPTMIESLVAVDIDVEPVTEEKQPSSGSSSGSERCWRCNGSGNCSNCGGDGRVTEWMGDQYMDVRCTSCMSGNCPSCNGSGKK